MTAVPTLSEVRSWIGVPTMEISDDQLALVLSGEVELQNLACPFGREDVPTGEVPEPLAQAILRRCARAVAAKGLPLGSLPSAASGQGAEFGLPGTMILPRLDAEIERYEAPFRLTGIA